MLKLLQFLSLGIPLLINLFRDTSRNRDILYPYEYIKNTKAKSYCPMIWKLEDNHYKCSLFTRLNPQTIKGTNNTSLPPHALTFSEPCPIEKTSKCAIYIAETLDLTK